jgi:P-type Ca2+ transporter type 2C
LCWVAGCGQAARSLRQMVSVRWRLTEQCAVQTWVLMRYLIVGLYVGAATVGIFAAWYLLPSLFGIAITADGHSTVTWHQLTNFDKCASWPNFRPAMSYTVAGGGEVSWSHPCDYFGAAGKAKASTLSLTVLVAIEMFNALNALSEDSSLLRVPPWKNPWLLVAIVLSFSLHCLIMYVPVLASVFSIVPLTVDEWLLVVAFAAPVVLIDEVLKQVGRWIMNPVQAGPKEKVA